MAFVCPKNHPPIPAVPRKPHAIRQEPLAQSAPAGLRHQKEQPQLGRVLIGPDAKDAAQPLPALPCDEGPLTGWVMVCRKTLEDLADEQRKTRIEPLIAGV